MNIAEVWSVMIQKTLLFSAVCILFLANTTAQNAIPNPGFENWTNFGNYDDPDGWATLNQETSLVFITTVTKATGADAHSGTYAIQLETTQILTETVPGTAITGIVNPLTLEIEGGFAYNLRPDSLTGWYKYLPVGIDACSVEVLLTKWNATTNLPEPIGSGIFIQPLTVNTYTNFSVTINYVSSQFPDTAIITLLSGAYNVPLPGSKLFVDDLAFNIATGINDPTSSKPIAIYPNPASDELFIQSNSVEAKLLIVDLLGNEISEMILNKSINKLNTSAFSNGIYIFNLIDTNENLLERGKLIVNH